MAQSFLSRSTFLDGPSLLRLRLTSRLTVLVATPIFLAIREKGSFALRPAPMTRLMLASRWVNCSFFSFMHTS